MLDCGRTLTVPFPVDPERVAEAEAALGRPLPPRHRARLLRDNGGEVEVEAHPAVERIWNLHPVRDDSDRRRLTRTVADIVRETEAAREWPNFPTGAISVAENGTGDRIMLDARGEYGWWDHETGATGPVIVRWEDDS